MRILRETAQQALEALEGFLRFAAIHSDGPDASDKYLAEDYAEEAFLKAAKVLPDLRAALAQQEQEQADYPEDKLQAVAEYVSNQYHVWYGVAARDIEEVLRQSVSCGLVSNPPRRETEQEPVAWVDSAELKHLSDDFEPVISKRAVSEYDIPLFTHPPRREWQSLSEEEIKTAVGASADFWASSALWIKSVARAVEQALKERNT